MAESRALGDALVETSVAFVPSDSIEVQHFPPFSANQIPRGMRENLEVTVEGGYC